MGKRGNGVQGTWAMRPTGAKQYRGYGYRGMGHMANKAHRGMGYRGYGHIGNRPQWVQGYGVQGVWATWVIGHMGNGAHGPMGNLHIFAHKIINTGWILTKI